MTVKTYEEGLRDGKLQAQEQIIARHDDRISSIDIRVARLEKIAWAMMGIIALMQFAPGVKAMFMGASVVGLK